MVTDEIDDTIETLSDESVNDDINDTQGVKEILSYIESDDTFATKRQRGMSKVHTE
jgi:hypothetical protein